MKTEREQLSTLEDLFKEKRFSDALQLVRKAIHDYPSSFQIKFMHVRILKELNKLKEAEDALKELMLIYPNNITLLLEGGNVLLLQNQFDGALDYYNKILFLDPFNTEAKNSIEKINVIKKTGFVDKGKSVDFISYESEQLHTAETLPEFDSRKLRELTQPPPPPVPEIEAEEPDLPPPPLPPIPEMETEQPIAIEEEEKLVVEIEKEEAVESDAIFKVNDVEEPAEEPEPPPSLPEMDSGEWEKIGQESEAQEVQEDEVAESEAVFNVEDLEERTGEHEPPPPPSLSWEAEAEEPEPSEPEPSEPSSLVWEAEAEEPESSEPEPSEPPSLDWDAEAEEPEPSEPEPSEPPSLDWEAEAEEPEPSEPEPSEPPSLDWDAEAEEPESSEPEPSEPPSLDWDAEAGEKTVESAEQEKEDTGEVDEKMMGIDESVWDQEQEDEQEDEQELTVMTLEPPSLEESPQPPEEKAEQIGREDEYEAVAVPEVTEVTEEPLEPEEAATPETAEMPTHKIEEKPSETPTEIEPTAWEKEEELIREEYLREKSIPAEPLEEEPIEDEELEDLDLDLDLDQEKVNQETEFVTESAAEVYVKQGLWDDALAVYQRLYDSQEEERYLIKINQLKQLQVNQLKIKVLDELLRIIKQKGERIV